MMRKIFEWIKIHRVMTILICLLLFVFPLALTNILHKIDAWHYLLMAEWSPGEFLGYCAAFLSFIGTAILGVIAVWQTERANQRDELYKQTEIECIRYGVMPRFIINRVIAKDYITKVKTVDKKTLVTLNVESVLLKNDGTTCFMGKEYAYEKAEIENSPVLSFSNVGFGLASNFIISANLQYLPFNRNVEVNGHLDFCVIPQLTKSQTIKFELTFDDGYMNKYKQGFSMTYTLNQLGECFIEIEIISEPVLVERSKNLSFRYDD